MSNQKVIYTKRIAYELRKLGFKILEVGINPNHPEFDTYIFEETPEFSEALRKLSANSN